MEFYYKYNLKNACRPSFVKALFKFYSNVSYFNKQYYNCHGINIAVITIILILK